MLDLRAFATCKVQASWCLFLIVHGPSLLCIPAIHRERIYMVENLNYLLSAHDKKYRNPSYINKPVCFPSGRAVDGSKNMDRNHLRIRLEVKNEEKRIDLGFFYIYICIVHRSRCIPMPRIYVTNTIQANAENSRFCLLFQLLYNDRIRS
jgi:hypothetical protein